MNDENLGADPVTTEMVEAGAKEWWAWQTGDNPDPKILAKNVYLAMRAQRPTDSGKRRRTFTDLLRLTFGTKQRATVGTR